MRLVGVGGAKQQWIDLIRSVLHSTAVTSSTVCLTAANAKVIITMPYFLWRLTLHGENGYVSSSVEAESNSHLESTRVSFFKANVSVLHNHRRLCK